MIYNYYPGCTLSTKARTLDQTARACAEALGFPLVELPEWQCCGAVYPIAADAIAERLSSARALVAARDNGGTLVTLCSACHHVIKRVNADMKTNKTINARINKYLQLQDNPYNGETRVLHFLEVIKKEIGFDKLSEMVKKPLTGRRVGAYYGCMLLRPAGVMQFDKPEKPTILEDFITTLGATPVIYDRRNECCAGYLTITDREFVREIVGEIISSARDQHAEELITACPLCSYNLVANAGEFNRLPVRYFTELLAEALGLGEVQ